LIAQGENDLISDGKLGNFYKYINHKLNGSSGIGPLLNSSGEIEHSAHAKATLFNDCFSSVFIVDNDAIDPARWLLDNSRIANSRTGRLADWTSRRLDSSRMPPATLRA